MMKKRSKTAASTSMKPQEKLHDALARVDVEAVEKALALGARPRADDFLRVFEARWSGEAPFDDDLAAPLAVLDALRAAGLALDATDDDGDTLLIAAIRWADAALVDALLRRGARPPAHALVIALNQRDRRLMIHPTTRTRHGRHARTALRLLDAGVDAGLVGPEGESLLHYAVQRDSRELVQRALAMGVTPAGLGRGALAWVEPDSDPGIFEDLLAAGAHPDEPGRFGATLLWHLASSELEPRARRRSSTRCANQTMRSRARSEPHGRPRRSKASASR